MRKLGTVITDGASLHQHGLYTTAYVQDEKQLANIPEGWHGRIATAVSPDGQSFTGVIDLHSCEDRIVLNGSLGFLNVMEDRVFGDVVVFHIHVTGEQFVALSS